MKNKFETIFNQKDLLDKNEELNNLIAEANDFIANYKSYFDMIGGSKKDSPEYVLDKDINNSNYWYNHEDNQIGISLKGFIDLKKGDLEKPQILFVVGHELGHLNDMQEDPKSYIKNFEKHQKKALKLAPKVLEAWEKRGIKLPDWLDEKKVADQFLYQQFKDLYNVLDDIYVNRHNLRAMPRFKGDFNGFNNEVRDMYADYFFANKNVTETGEKALLDYSKLPRAKQFLYYILRKYMVPDEEIIISDEVKEKLYGFLSNVDKKYNNNILKCIYDMARPASLYEEKQNIAGERYKWIEKWIEPIFVDLLLKDINDMPPPKFSQQDQGGGKDKKEGKEDGQEGQEDGQEGKEDGQEGQEEEQEGKQDGQEGKEDGQEGQEDGQEGQEGKQEDKENNQEGDIWKNVSDTESIDIETVKRFLKEKKEVERRKKEDQAKKTLSPEELIKKQQMEIDKKTAQEKGLSKNDVEVYEILSKDVEPYKRQLAEVFKELMENIKERILMEWESGWKRGRFNIDNFIDKYGDLLVAGQVESIPWEKLDVYDQRSFTSKLSLFPNKIRFRLVIDSSGSMNSGDKRLEAKRLSVLMMEALKIFESEMNQKFRLKEEFYVDTQIICYGSEGNTEVVKEFDSDNKEDDKQVERWRAVKGIDVDRGTTVNDEAWKMINNSINYEDELKNDKAMEFCFEITDGEVNSNEIAKKSRSLVDSLTEKGVNVMGFLIDSNESSKFDMIWNESTSEQRGFKVNDPSELVSVISERFAKIIQNKQIKVMSEDIEIDED